MLDQISLRLALALTGLGVLFSTTLFAAPFRTKVIRTVQPTINGPAPGWLEILPAGSDESEPSTWHVLPPTTPKGKPLRANPAECSSLTLEKLLAVAQPTPQAQTQTLQSFFDRCDKILSRFSPTKYGSLLSLIDQNYDITERPELSELVFNLPLGIHIHGLLGLKPSAKPRPLIVVVSGTGGDLTGISARAMLGALYDETPFNVLVLPSATSSQFIADNQLLVLGGFEESRIVYEIVRLLAGDDSPYRKFISSFHVAGVSLGGNTALFAGVYGTSNPLPAGQAQIQSIFGYCPAVDLRTSIDDLDRKGTTGKLYRRIIENDTVGNLDLLGAVVPDPLPDFAVPLGHHGNVKFTEAWITPSLQELVKRPDFVIAPFSTGQVENAEKFWANNNFLNYSSKVKIPTVLFASDNDFVVNIQNNSIALKRQLSADNGDAPIGIFHAKKGWHCMMTQTYGEDIFSTAVKGIILASSPEFHIVKTKVPFDSKTIQEMKSVTLRSDDEKYFGYRWAAHEKSANATLTYQIYTPSRRTGQTDVCDKFSPYTSFEGCFRQHEVKVALADFNLKNEMNSSKPQAQALTRWLNSHVKVLTTQGGEPVDTTSEPAYFEVSSD